MSSHDRPDRAMHPLEDAGRIIVVQADAGTAQ